MEYSLKSSFRLNPYVAWILIFFAIALRLLFMDIIEFKKDEFDAIVLAWRNIHATGIAQVGLKSSQILYNPPFFIYLISIPVFFTTDPIPVTLFVSFLNIAGILILFLLMRRMFSRYFALLVTLLFATSPWAIIFSRKIWAQNCIFPFMMLLYWLIYSMLCKYSRFKLYFIFISLSILTQLHMSAWFLPLPLLVFILLTMPKVPKRHLLFSCFMSIIPYIPYIYFHVKTRGENIVSFLHAGQNNFHSLANIPLSFVVTTGSSFRYLIGNSIFENFAQAYHLKLPLLLYPVYYVFATAGIIYGIIFLFHKLKQYSQISAMPAQLQMLALFLFTYLCIQICYIIFKVPPATHYNIIFYPIISIFIVLFLSTYVSRFQKVIRRSTFLFLLLFSVFNLYFMASFFGFIQTHRKMINHAYGRPYSETRSYWLPLLKKAKIQIENLSPNPGK